MRIQKHLSMKGILSRREAEKYIQAGYIKVNGKLIKNLAHQIDPMNDIVTLHAPDTLETKQLIAFHKPVGVVTHSPQAGEKEIKDLLPSNLKHLSPVGRLDKASEGLILLTNDGVLARYFLQSKPAHLRCYIVSTSSSLTHGQLQKCRNGIILFGQRTKPINITPISAHSYKWEMREGKNRQIRRMVQKIGSQVTRLQRISFANIQLGELKSACYRVEKIAMHKASIDDYAKKGVN